MSVGQLVHGEWFYRFQYSKRSYRRQGFKSKTEAERQEAIKKSEVICNPILANTQQNNIKLMDITKMYLEEYADPYKRSAKHDGSYIKVIDAFFGEKRMRDIGPLDIDAFRRHLRDTRVNRRGEKITDNTVNHYHAELKAIIQWAKKRRVYFGENPAWGVAMAKVPKGRVRFLLPTEEVRLTSAIVLNRRLWPYYVIGLHTGMRLGEILAIRVKDIIWHPNPMVFVPNSKTHRSRYVPLHGKAIEIMADRLDRPSESHAIEGLSGQTIIALMKKITAKAQVANFTFHCLRHSFAAHLLQKGVPIYIVSKMLGHSSVKTTEDHYGHLDKSAFMREIHHIGDIMTAPDSQVVNEPSIIAVNSLSN